MIVFRLQFYFITLSLIMETPNRSTSIQDKSIDSIYQTPVLAPKGSMGAVPRLKKKIIKDGKKEKANSAQSKGGAMKRSYGVMSSSTAVKNRNAHLFRTPEKLSSQVYNISCRERAARAPIPIELDTLPRSPTGLRNLKTLSSPLLLESPVGTPGKQEE